MLPETLKIIATQVNFRILDFRVFGVTSGVKMKTVMTIISSTFLAYHSPSIVMIYAKTLAL